MTVLAKQHTCNVRGLQSDVVPRVITHARATTSQKIVRIRATPSLQSPQACHNHQTKQQTPPATKNIMLLQNALHAAWRRVGNVAAAAALSALLVAPSLAEDQIIRFPASSDAAIFGAQKTLVEAWQIVRDMYVDSSFAGTDWDKELLAALTAAYESPDGEAAFRQISKMLEKLGDPFTRIVPPSEYADFRVSSDGEVQGVGLLIASDPSSGKLMVLSPIKGGPADRAGLKPGDLVVSIDGKETDGWDGDRAAKSLRGRSGSSVVVKLARRTEQIPGVAGIPEQQPKVEYKLVRLRREKVELSPVFSTAVHHEGKTFGYIRLMNFGQHAAQDMAKAINDLQRQDVQGFILDLRNNPGGLVKSGLEVARLWMDGEAPIFNLTGRPLANSNQVATTERVVLNNGKASTGLPLTVLINENSASASEILAGALHDNGRAELVGRTSYGKGRMQSVYELTDGSALFVTVAKYKTPNMSEIDRVGIRPDLSCSLPRAPPPAPSRGSFRRAPMFPSTASWKQSEEVAEQPSSESGPYIPIASVFAGGAALEQQLQGDTCVLTAERILEGKLGSLATSPSSPALANIGSLMK